MGRFLKQIVAVMAVGAAAVTSAAGCADNTTSLFIEGVLAPDPPECAVKADPGSTILGEGVLDVVFSQEYRAWLLVGNQMSPRGIKTQARAETMRVVLTGAEINLEDVGGSSIGSFTVPGTGFANVNRSQNPGYGAVLTTLIPPETGASLAGNLAAAGTGSRQTIVANVKVFGETLGGDSIDSAELSFPIQVCYGCTIVYPIDAIESTPDPNNPGEYVDTCTLGTADTTPPCFTGQGGIDCRTCASTYDACKYVPAP
jgi:hypothetical protein